MVKMLPNTFQGLLMYFFTSYGNHQTI